MKSTVSDTTVFLLNRFSYPHMFCGVISAVVSYFNYFFLPCQSSVIRNVLLLFYLWIYQQLRVCRQLTGEAVF